MTISLLSTIAVILAWPALGEFAAKILVGDDRTEETDDDDNPD